MDKEKLVSQNQPAIRVMILDHHTLFRDGLRLLIDSCPCMQVVSDSGASEQAIELAQLIQPDIILLELNLDACLDIEIIPEMLSARPQARILLVTGITETALHQQAIQMGAMGVVRKSESSQTLLKAIQKVHEGEVWIDRFTMAKVLSQVHQGFRDEPEDPEASSIALLSPREHEVIRLVGEGLKNNDIADRLSISDVTVRHHLTSIYRKLGVNDRLELTIYAYRNNLAPLPA